MKYLSEIMYCSFIVVSHHSLEAFRFITREKSHECHTRVTVSFALDTNFDLKFHTCLLSNNTGHVFVFRSSLFWGYFSLMCFVLNLQLTARIAFAGRLYWPEWILLDFIRHLKPNKLNNETDTGTDAAFQ